MTDSPLKKISLIQELDLAVETVKSGLSLVQSIQPYRTPVFLIFLVLSTGLERIMKIVLGMRLLTDEGRFLSRDELQRYGHNLRKLAEAVLDRCFNGEATTPPIRRDDYLYIRNDELLNTLLCQLSEFAVRDRYVYMNGIVEPESLGTWLGDRWGQIENVVIPPGEAVKYFQDGKEEEYKNWISLSLTICVEKLLGGLGRSITLGDMNKEANSAGTLLYDFVLIREKEFGAKKYELFGHTPI